METVHFPCPNEECGKELFTDRSNCGKSGRCQFCLHRIVIPHEGDVVTTEEKAKTLSQSG